MRLMTFTQGQVVGLFAGLLVLHGILVRRFVPLGPVSQLR